MSGTTRRHSPAVYRRRRLVLLIALLAIIATVWLLVAQPWRGAASENSASADDTTQDAATELPIPSSGSPSSTPGATPAATPGAADAEPSPTPSATLTPAADPCVARDITVEARTDQDTYGSGQNPKLSIRLTNNGADCTLNVGTSGQSFAISSGSDTWWRSTDCQTEPSDMIVLLAAGQTVESSAPLEWDRTRSAVGTCEATDRPHAPGGGSSYHLDVEIGGIASTSSKQFLLY
jgi:cytoskeletal protein RodZ